MASVDSPSDMDKIKEALSFLSEIGSLDDVLAMAGLRDMPTAQKYGIMFGCMTFALTCVAVFALLTFGGSFTRMQQQATGELTTAPDAVSARKGRALLLERLLEAREWMLKTNYPPDGNGGVGKFTALTKMLMNLDPSEIGGEEKTEFNKNYNSAYLKCQDQPGGPILGGRPDSRFESYARAFAGCGDRPSHAYRWSYARMYESLACKSYGTDDQFKEHFESRPQDIIGRTVRLEPLEEDRHLATLWDITSGRSNNEHKSYDPDEVWGFLDFGPFKTKEQMRDSFVFRRQRNEAAFAIIESVTNRLMGVIHVTKDDPQNLNVQIELPIVKPSSDGTVEQIEACFLLVDRLFAYGYRRVQLCIDTLDVAGKRLPGRLGFTQEGQIPKCMIVKDANRDSLIYGMLNSDWDKGARSFLFKKLHGAKGQQVDDANTAKDAAAHDMEEQLRQKKEEERAEEESNTKNKKV